jgi:hypothetical protein
VPPTVTGVSVPADGAYRAGDALTFTVNFDETMLVSTTGGTPRLGVNIGGTIIDVDYVTGSGTNALTFTYTVQRATRTNGIALSSIALNSGTITDAAGNDAMLALNNVASTAGVRVNTPAAATGATVPADGTYRAGDSLSFTVAFGETVTVDTAGGTPSLPLTIGSSIGPALWSPCWVPPLRSGGRPLDRTSVCQPRRSYARLTSIATSSTCSRVVSEYSMSPMPKWPI